MTERKLKVVKPRLEALVAQDRDLLKALVKEALDQILQAEMTDFLGAGPNERNLARAGYRATFADGDGRHRDLGLLRALQLRGVERAPAAQVRRRCFGGAQRRRTAVPACGRTTPEDVPAETPRATHARARQVAQRSPAGTR